jgi:hypothetical protein
VRDVGERMYLKGHQPLMTGHDKPHTACNRAIVQSLAVLGRAITQFRNLRFARRSTVGAVKVIRRTDDQMLLIKYIINSSRAPRTAVRFGIQLPSKIRFHR